MAGGFPRGVENSVFYDFSIKIKAFRADSSRKAVDTLRFVFDFGSAAARACRKAPREEPSQPSLEVQRQFKSSSACEKVPKSGLESLNAYDGGAV
ncbi:hypothetical protein cyc_08801 [Cyclospora cayetanensis]|uniref:Uncharacterized protein n=1 Tax=Cyclospora cayetanensis TaxID=88456 RepID=A0A1D3D4I0_9EIME|nr:hypothetical protein cyc_08801 [Cyclospora cayetanensis]